MSIKLTDLEAANISAALNSVSKELDFSLSYSIGRVLDGLKITLKGIDREKVKLLKELGILKEDGTKNDDIVAEKANEFTEKFTQALEENTQDYGFSLIQKSKLEKYDWTPQFLSTIMPVILEDEEIEPVMKKVE